MKAFHRAVTIVAIAAAVSLGNSTSATANNWKPNVTNTGQMVRGLSVKPRSDDNYLFDLGVSKQENEDFVGAIEHYTEFLKTHPFHLDAYCNRGFSRAMVGQVKGSIADFSRAIEIAPNYADAYNARGNVHALVGNLPASIRDFNRAISIDRNFADAYYNRAISRHSLGDRRGARKDLTKASQLFRLQRDIGGYQQATEWLQKIRSTSSKSLKSLK
jgi:tetratricopeptide (TPR) repeat protein